MRISDWSSDVCSSDLLVGAQRLAARQEEVAGKAVLHGDHVTDEAQLLDPFKQDDLHDWPSLFHDEGQEADMARALDRLRQLRSEEHTSELQSLMRISYAVFCLKKKT